MASSVHPKSVPIGVTEPEAVGVAEIDSVDVAVGGCAMVGITAAVSVNSATTVCATEVLIALMSGVGAAGKAGEQAANNRTPISKRTLALVLTLFPFGVSKLLRSKAPPQP